MTVHRHRQRQAFQLIELIVVIVILVVLLGVFFPATHQVRIGPVRQTTINNLRQLVIAAHNAHDTYKKFPPYFGFYPGTRAGTSSVQSAERSIFVHILPFIEGSTIYNQNPFPAVVPAFDPYISPLDPTSRDGTDGNGNGVTSYLANQRAFPTTYARMPKSYKAGMSNCVFFVTCVGVPTSGGADAHIWSSSTCNFIDNLSGDSLPQPLSIKPWPAQRPMQLTPGGAQVSMGDASSRSVHPHISAAVWAAVTNPEQTRRIPSDWNQ